MLNIDCKSNMITSNTPNKSPRVSNKLSGLAPPPPVLATDVAPANDADCAAYEQYIRLPELKKLWSVREFAGWVNEPVMKPALSALEITFRFVSTVMSDPRPYTNRREWTRRLESLGTSQLQIIALLCEDEENSSSRGKAPITDLSSDGAALSRENSSAEVWKLRGETTVVSRGSEVSLLPRLATWQKTEDIAEKFVYSIECEMRNCPYTLGLGEPNLSGKPTLDYDLICKPVQLHALKRSHLNIENSENQSLYTIYQILESWIDVSNELLKRIGSQLDNGELKSALNDCWIVERIWKLLAEIEDLHLLMDPDDFLRLKTQLMIKSEAFCFRSRGLVEITKLSKDLKHKVPQILGVEVDPTGGPAIQEAAMKLYQKTGESGLERIHLLQALQGIESALKRFYYSYKQVIVNVMGSLQATGKFVYADSADLLGQIYLEPTYFPSLDAAKTFLGEYWLTHGKK
ncbi:hypothetical protein DCAR_0313322 [Daucus carota subsp. sativus]|uniref:Hs1pro-1 C-terminal domain-containing protein n=1 Tax=Daucus carota subsp. sativus TaxID=79200 RepID=A0A166BY66_DAUCS|nr:PREDICTED: nematode resistance protein-like HSPRO2 [Daucus carota subsp. sativus]WOG94032.1 hypothetical protein DCAR_0313322 [Daucus carota subsp. sativus]